MIRGRTPRWKTPFAVVALLVLSLNACSADEPPQPGPTSSLAPAETTPEVMVTKPARSLDYPTPASAVAFVQYFWNAYNYAYATHDTSLLKQISGSTCEYCQARIEDVRKQADSGSRVEGFEAEMLHAAVPTRTITDRALVVSVTRQSDGVAISRDGSRTSISGFENMQFSFALAWTGGQWVVHGVDYRKPSS